MALITCPSVEIPPSAITGTPNLLAYSATLYTAPIPLPLPYHPEYRPVEAPNDIALMICPSVEIPPSAITGTPNLLAYSATLYTAVACGRPTAITAKAKMENILLHPYCAKKNIYIWWNICYSACKMKLIFQIETNSSLQNIYISNIYTWHWLPIDEHVWTNWLHTSMKVNWSHDIVIKWCHDEGRSWLVNISFDWRQDMTTAV